jgi:hypothetical protein
MSLKLVKWYFDKLVVFYNDDPTNSHYMMRTQESPPLAAAEFQKHHPGSLAQARWAHDVKQ